MRRRLQESFHISPSGMSHGSHNGGNGGSNGGGIPSISVSVQTEPMGGGANGIMTTSLNGNGHLTNLGMTNGHLHNGTATANGHALTGEIQVVSSADRSHNFSSNQQSHDFSNNKRCHHDFSNNFLTSLSFQEMEPSTIMPPMPQHFHTTPT